MRANSVPTSSQKATVCFRQRGGKFLQGTWTAPKVTRGAKVVAVMKEKGETTPVGMEEYDLAAAKLWFLWWSWKKTAKVDLTSTPPRPRQPMGVSSGNRVHT